MMKKPELILRDWIDINKLNFNFLSYNTSAIDFFNKNPDKICWFNISANLNAIEIMDDDILSQNKNAIHLIRNINFKLLSINPNAINILLKNPEKIDWRILSSNEGAMDLLIKNPYNIDWNLFSSNPSAIEILKENQDKIDWISLSSNPAIFTYDYKKMRKNNENFEEELIKEFS